MSTRSPATSWSATAREALTRHRGCGRSPTTDTASSTRLDFDEELFASGRAATPSGRARAADRRHVVRHPGPGLRLRSGHRRADCCASAAGARRASTARLRAAPRLGGGRRRHADPDLDRRDARARPRPGPDPAVRLRLATRPAIDPRFLDRAAVAARPRHGVRDRARARRRRDGPALVRARQDAARRRTRSPTSSRVRGTSSTPA